MMKGISFAIFLPYTELITTTRRVTSAQIRHAPAWASIMNAPSAFLAAPTASPMAFPERERPMIATVGPITTAGMSLSIQFTPTSFTIIAMRTYTKPANTAPMMSPRYPAEAETPPAKAAAIEPKNANDEPKNTGLLNFVNKRYTIVPAPAPKSAADCDMPLPITAGTAIVAAKIASSC